MKLPARLLAVAGLATAVVALWPVHAAAQRRAVIRPAGRSTVIVGAYYRPLFFDPWYAYPFGYRYGYPFGWYPPPFYYGQWGGYYDMRSALRLQVEPRETEVFIDGYFAGPVDEFDGFFQRLRLEPGEHTLELYLPGHRSVQRRIYLQPGNTFRVRHTMEALQPGEAEPARPVAAAPPAGGTVSAGPAARRPAPGDAPPARRAPRAAAAFGALSLRVQPGDAEVLIDGERWEGAAPGERLEVQIGTGVHQVEIRREGYRSYISEVTIRDGETTSLNVALARP